MKLKGKANEFKKWFFKGRIEKVKAKEENLLALSEEYDKGMILNKKIVGGRK